jgi:hypothetical protein
MVRPVMAKQSLQLSVTEIKSMTKWPDPIVLQFLSLINSISALGGNNIKTLRGTTGAAAGNTVSVAHGIDPAKIISLTAVVNDGTTVYCPCSPVAADEYSITADVADVKVTNGAAATTILAQLFVVTVIYGD